MADGEDPNQEPDSRNWRNLEKARDDAQAEAAKWKGLFDTARTQLISSSVQIAGFKPDDEGKFDGVTSLLVEKFQSSLGDEDLPAADAFVSLAEQFGVPLPTSAAPEGDPSAGDPPNDLAAQIAVLQGHGDKLAAIGQAPKPADLDAQIAEAEKAGNIALSMRLKDQKFYGDATGAA